MRLSKRGRLGKVTVVAVTLLVAIGATAVSSAGAERPSAYDLTGFWTTPGTSLTLTQTGRSLTWTGGPDNRAWIQTFEGKITDDPFYGPFFSGTFRQDEPGRLPPRYSGTMKAQINDSCSFTFLSIVQAGQPTVRNISFRKTPCAVTTRPLASLKLILYKKRYDPERGQARSCPSSFECVVRNGAVVRICNRDDFYHQPWSQSAGNSFGGKGKLILKTGDCYQRRLVNRQQEAIQVKLYDWIHSQERFIVTVLPTRR